MLRLLNGLKLALAPEINDADLYYNFSPKIFKNLFFQQRGPVPPLAPYRIAYASDFARFGHSYFIIILMSS